MPVSKGVDGAGDATRKAAGKKMEEKRKGGKKVCYF